MNSVNIIGRLTRDPELKYIPSGSAVCTFSIACDDGTKDKPHCSFFDVTAWQRTGEIVAEYAKKGHQIACNGRLEQQTWKDKTDGSNRSKVQIVASHVTLLSNKRDSADQSPSQYAEESRQAGTVGSAANGFDGSREVDPTVEIPF
jgi:single-strand DNA-binding protein